MLRLQSRATEGIAGRMQVPGHLPPPDDSGSASGEGFAYQAQATLRAVMEMLAGGEMLHVTCEHFEDVLVARTDEAGPDGAVLSVRRHRPITPSSAPSP